MKYAILLLALTCFAVACGSSDPDQKMAHDKVMEIHDEVMPKTSEIQRLIRSLKKHLAATEGEAALAADVRAKVEQVVKQLEAADEGMMSWMSNYKKPKGGTDKASAMAYLEKEKNKIAKVRDDMLSSIKGGDELLKSLTAATE